MPGVRRAAINSRFSQKHTQDTQKKRAFELCITMRIVAAIRPTLSTSKASRNIPIAARWTAGYDQDMSKPRRLTFCGWGAIASLATLLTYLLSFGPACWIASRDSKIVNSEFVDNYYVPVLWLCRHSPPFVRTSLKKYANFGVRPNKSIEIANDCIELWHSVGSFEITISCSFGDETEVEAKSETEAKSP